MPIRRPHHEVADGSLIQQVRQRLERGDVSPGEVGVDSFLGVPFSYGINQDGTIVVNRIRREGASHTVTADSRITAFVEANGTPISEVLREAKANASEDRKKRLFSELKRRHLSQNERQFLHEPKSDWVQQGGKEVCKNACALVVDDIVESYSRTQRV
jgi:hypothetical protein